MSETSQPPETPQRKKPGRVPMVIDGDKVEELASIFLTREEIAARVGCKPEVLTRRYSNRMKKGRELAKSSLRGRQFSVAMGRDEVPAEYDAVTGKKTRDGIKGKDPNVTMLIFLGKQYLGQSDKMELHSETEQSGFVFLTNSGRIVGLRKPTEKEDVKKSDPDKSGPPDSPRCDIASVG